MEQLALVPPQEVGNDDIVLDVRRHRGGRQIYGAVRYDPHALLKAESLDLPLDRARRIVLNADDSGDIRSLWWRFNLSGFRRVVGLAGGFEAWDQAGLPEEDATQDQPVPGVPSAGLHRF